MVGRVAVHHNASPDVELHALQTLHRGHGRELLEQRVRGFGGHGQALDLAIHEGGWNRAGHGQESHVDLPTHQVGQQGCNAFVGHVQHVDLGELGEPLANQVVKRTWTHAAIAQGFAVAFAGQSQQLVNGLDVERVANGQNRVGGGKLSHQFEVLRLVLHALDGQGGQHQLHGAGQAQGGAVGRGADELAQADRAACAADVLDDHGLFAQSGGRIGLNLAGEKVGRTTGRVGHDQADWLDGIGLRDGGTERAGGNEQAADKGFDVHDVSCGV